MPSLSKADDRFPTLLQVLEGGSGFFHGTVTEPNQGDGSSQSYALPRSMLRVPIGSPVKAGMALKSPISGEVFLVGDNGDSIGIFRSFRMIRVARRFSWQTRIKAVETVTGLERDTELSPPTDVWGTYEPQQEAFDRGMHISLETGKFLTNAPIKRDDLVDNRKVTRVDPMMGLYLATLG